MKYISTNKHTSPIDFKAAALAGMAPDQGLFFPERIPVLPVDFIKELKSKSKAEVAFEIIQPYVGDSIPADELRKICKETVDFDFPLVKISEAIYSLELFHGPTLAFKDVGARFMSRCLGYFSTESKKKTTVLVATSGDTGSAVANSFLGVEGIEVIILYPSGKVSNIQELQLTTLGNNISAIEIEGDFDDCQRLVKEAFADKELNEQMNLVSANSINIARWLSQQFYYFYAIQQWPHEEPPVVCVPSGNFGNICAGLLAHASGLPAKHFIAACNKNDTFFDYLKNGEYVSKSSVPTISNAMDVGSPSNFVRVLELFQGDYMEIKSKISSNSISDEVTKQTILKVYEKYGYLLDPHGAVAYSSLEEYLKTHPEQKGFILETAHPVKFNNVVESIIGREIEVPFSVRTLKDRTKKSIVMKPDYNLFRTHLIL